MTWVMPRERGLGGRLGRSRKSGKRARSYRANAGGGSPWTVMGTPASAYQGCAISEPAKDQTFTNVDALSVVVRTDPGLRPGDRVYLTLDGQPLNGGKPTGSQFTLSPVDRGTHVVQAIVRDSQGGLMCQSPGVTFNVHQPSLRNPANPLHH